MKKTIVNGALALSVVLTLLAGCGSGATTNAKNAQPSDTPKPASTGTAAPAKSTTLTLMANQDWVNKPMMQKAWKLYEEKTGNKLDIQAVPIDSWEKVMKVKFATGEVTDIVMYYGGYQLQAIQPDKNFVDMSDQPWVSDLKDFVLPQIKVNNKIYGFPLWEGSVSGMLYNKEIFKKYNIAIPKTQEEFLAACETLKKNGVAPIYMGFKDIWPLLPQFGLDPVFKKYPDLLNKINSNQTKFADVKELNSLVSWYKTLADKGYLGDKFSTNTWDGQATALLDGKYAMAYAWDTYLQTDIETKVKGASSKFGLMPMFLGVNDEGTFEGPNAIATYVNKNSKNVDAAKQFIAFLADPANLNEIYKDQPTQTYFKSVTTNKPTDQYTEIKEVVDKLINPSIQQNIVGYSQVELVKPIQDLMLGDKTPEQAIKEMDATRIKAAQAQQIPGF